MEEAWLLESHGHTMVWVEGKIGHCQYKQKWWSKVAIGNITRQLKEKKEHLRKVEDAAIGGKSMGRLFRLEREINDLLSKEGKCGGKDHALYGRIKVMEILDFSIVELLIDYGEIELRC